MTQRYEVRLARRAVRSLALLQRQEQLRIRAAIDLLAENPRPPGCVALQGEPGVFRVRVGDFRILYEVVDRLLLVRWCGLGTAGRSTAEGAPVLEDAPPQTKRSLIRIGIGCPLSRAHHRETGDQPSPEGQGGITMLPR